MKHTTISFFVLALLIFCGVNAYAQTKAAGGSAWSGNYSYEIPGPVMYTLNIQPNDTVVYEGSGMQTFFKVICYGVVKDGRYEIYYVRTDDGAYFPADWIDKSKPIMTLYYEGETLKTDEGQTNKEVKGGQVLFKKSS